MLAALRQCGAIPNVEASRVHSTGVSSSFALLWVHVYYTHKCIHNIHLCGVVAVNTHTHTHTHTPHNYGLVAVPIRGITDVYKAAARSGWAHFAHSPVPTQVY